MGFNLEMKNHLECIDGEGFTIHYVGDNVVCEAGGKRYIGKIASIGYYRREQDSEPQPAMYIDTSKNDTSYSGEVVMVDDITYLYIEELLKQPKCDFVLYVGNKKLVKRKEFEQYLSKSLQI